MKSSASGLGWWIVGVWLNTPGKGWSHSWSEKRFLKTIDALNWKQKLRTKLEADVLDSRKVSVTLYEWSGSRWDMV